MEPFKDPLSEMNLPQPATSSMSGIEAAKSAAGQIFSSYPDYGKAPKEYLATVIDYLATLPPYVLNALADKRLGIATKSTYMPTIAEIKVAADLAIDSRNQALRYEAIQRRKLPLLKGPRTPFRPFPALWAAFSDEPTMVKVLDEAPTFAFLDDAARALATRGKEAARQIICG